MRSMPMSDVRATPPPRAGARWRSVVAASASLLVVVVVAAACGEDGPTGDASSERGAEVYATSCASCHGDDLRGTAVGPPLLSELYVPANLSDEEFQASITDGAPAVHWEFGPMPMVGAVRGSDLDAVIAYVRERQAVDTIEPAPDS